LPGGSNDGRGDATSTQENIILDTVRLYLEATVAVAVMAMLGIISGFATVALTGDGRQAFFVAAVAFVLTAIVLTVRLWRMTRMPIASAEPPV
jgi:hypothetical protein